jgi:penicillin-binding protein 1C
LTSRVARTGVIPAKAGIQRLRRLAVVIAAIAAVLFALDRAFPPPVPDLARTGSTLVLARDGTPLRAFAGPDGVWRYPARVEDVSPLYIEALLGYEDRWFRRHPGVNPLALARAAWQALRNGRIVSGGSTLTMQVARLIEPGPRHVGGKLRQIARALQLEWRLDKDEILRLYLDLAPFGGNIQGVEAASWAYLGKPARNLSHAEAALLAVLPQAPSRLRPDRHPAVARAARDKVLTRLADLGTWPPDALAEAALEPVTARRLRAPMAAALLAERLHRERPDARVIRTPLDPALQMLVERRVAAYLRSLPDRTSAAVLVVDNETLEVRAYAGSARFGDEARLGHVDMVAAVRSPGSALKPFLYGLALDDGLIHSESLLVDAPRGFDGYRPANFGDRFNGPVGAAEALRLSLNVPAVVLLDAVGPERFAARLRHGGVALQLPRGARPNLSMILGGTGTTLEELAGAYAGLARDGLAGPPRLTADAPLLERRLLSPGAAWIVRAMLQAHGRPGEPGAGVDRSRRLPLAWKTGTSYGFRDTWAMGTSSRWTIGVWIGRPDGTPLPGHYGAVTSLPLLFALSDALPRSSADLVPQATPPAVTVADICWPLGTMPDPAHPGLCHRKRSAWILDGAIPPTLPDPDARPGDALQETWFADVRDGARVDAGCTTDAARPFALARWPARAQPWLARSELAAATPPAWSTQCAARELAPLRGEIHIDGAIAGSALRRPPGGTTPPTLALRALGADGDVSWLVNGRLAGTTRGAGTWQHAFGNRGTVTIVALDSRGRYDRMTLEIQQ